ncbi:tRNA threonylcarbamoyladenosine biosynthesis protein TsaE [Roseovarius litorisediminis]|uniref:tRNA threonylcarbamoyladenosine biosynthesis protein TsaE n=1 Tax=Roseovarius litorisediminis TaxID=1312363 RepID=A0A1Y5SS38_9RHOB|nr:tRNA (adenosine(37)-N6)-threonylcarbamoyltransferase complex ATPase subunit type 1 TsaE [Roseovarius litorisediminis]SLN43877.1 tRNA threonylcarbamoyladenosine biosynthesis protein TsaE [Roseovarius litorisediminis]
MSEHTAHLHLNSPEETSALAASIAPRLGPGDVLLLSGDVGAGKTHFARSLILALLTKPEDVPSPTYTLVQTYPGRNCEIWHADLYRLTDTGEVDELGLLDAFSQAICLVEWPDRLGDQAPATALHLHFDVPHGDDRRVLTLSWDSPEWDSTLKDICNV